MQSMTYKILVVEDQVELLGKFFVDLASFVFLQRDKS